MELPRTLQAELGPNNPTPAHTSRQDTTQKDARSPRLPAAASQQPRHGSNLNARRQTAKTRAAHVRRGAAQTQAGTEQRHLQRRGRDQGSPCQARPERERPMPHGTAFMENLKHDKNEPVYEAETESRHSRQTGGCQGGEGWRTGGVRGWGCRTQALTEDGQTRSYCTERETILNIL